MLKMPHKIPVYWKVFKNVNFKHAFESMDTTYTITKVQLSCLHVQIFLLEHLSILRTVTALSAAVNTDVEPHFMPDTELSCMNL